MRAAGQASTLRERLALHTSASEACCHLSQEVAVAATVIRVTTLALPGPTKPGAGTVLEGLHVRAEEK